MENPEIFGEDRICERILEKGMCVLEIGAGTGAFPAALRKSSVVAYGDRAGCHIRCFGGEDASHPDVSRNVCILMKKRPGAFPKKFDRIVLDQVLEHILIL